MRTPTSCLAKNSKTRENVPYDYTYMPVPGDTISCPACKAVGGQNGDIRIRGIMTDRQYNDRRCNKCGHKWTTGDSLELPFKPINMPIVPTSPDPQAVTKPSDYDFGDGWEPEPGSKTPF